ncbi:hypothetical protein [Acidiphilium sp.]|uniref:hypothetical protein n=1 Tax=Acidiphilium sp. TaxID=527 RepID=UPI0025853F52|nr:hypothetical protein [Acidiphilium sp.]
MKRTIYFNPTTTAILDFANEPNLSARVAQVAESWAMACDAGRIPRDEPDALASAMVRYRAMIDEAAPALRESEWALLCDALNGCVLTADHADTDPARHLAQSVADSEPDGLGEKWGVDVAALAARIERMPYAARCAIVETVGRFWRQAGSSMSPIGEQIRAAGAKVASGEEIAE